MERKSKLNKTTIVVSALLLILTQLVVQSSPIDQKIESFGKGFYYFILYLIAVLISTVWFRILWNGVVPAIFGFREISFWESLGISVLVAFFLMG